MRPHGTIHYYKVITKTYGGSQFDVGYSVQQTNDGNVMVNACVNDTEARIDKIMDINRYSSFDKMARITAYLLRFVHNSSLEKSKESCKIGYLTRKELDAAEGFWIRATQRGFYDDIKQMKQLKVCLGIYSDKRSILRCKGRLNNSQLAMNTRNSILLPKNDRLSFLLVRKSHDDTHHGNIKDTLTELRSKYWVINSRRMVTSYISKCILCNRLDGAPFKSQESAQLPSFRVCQSPPFSNTGVDYAGPLLVKLIYNNKIKTVESYESVT